MSSTEQQSASGGYISDSDNSAVSPGAGPLDPFSLSQGVRARRSEYTRQETIRIKVATWNVAGIHGTEEDIGKWFVNSKGISEGLSGVHISDTGKPEAWNERKSSDAGTGRRRSSTDASDRQRRRGSAIPSADFESDDVGLYALGLQEVVDISSATEALRPFTDPAPANRWKTAVQKALPPGYQLVAETQLLGLLLLIYAAPRVVNNISSVSTSSVGTGLLGYMGNKGAVSTRLVLGETTSMVFVNSHLAAGSDKGSLERRNWDAAQIINRTKYSPIDLEKGPPDYIGKEDFAFWFGDLNYRLGDIPGGDVRQVLSRHTENEYDKRHQSTRTLDDRPSSPRIIVEEGEMDPPLSSTSKGHPALSDREIDPHTDPASLQTTIASLLPHDQLRIQQQNGKAFHEGWREGDITFLPTYKYDVGSVARFDSSEKHRGPSWCDRILFRTREDKQRHERLDRELAESRRKDEEMKARGLDKAAADDNVLFDYDPEVDGADSVEENEPSKDKSDDGTSSEYQLERDGPIRLEYYVSHQGILSSDHKPLDAGFTLTFESVIPELKAKVHQEVVRELDKAENEARPGLTVVVDKYEEDVRNAEEKEDPNSLDFGGITVDVPITRSLTVANTSGVPATFTFDRPNPEERQFNWLDYRISLRAEPEHDGKKPKTPEREKTLVPGEVANIEVTAHVQDLETIRLLNHGLVRLEEIMVLRVANGPDHFISVSAQWLPTCFGRSVVDLTRMPEAGARSLVAPQPPEQAKDDKGVRLSAPRELFRLTEAISELSERAVAEWGMTRGDSEDSSPPWRTEPYGPGWPFNPETWTLKGRDERAPLLARVRESLDTNGSLTTIFEPEISSLERLEILSETLMVFLRSLNDGIITADVWQNMNTQIIAREKSKQNPLSWEETQAWVLENLSYSPAHSVSFTFVTFMLARIANEVAPALSTPPPHPSSHHQHSKKSSEDKKRQQSPREAKDQQSQNDAPTPTPASSAAFISAGSFRRQSRSFTTSSSSSSSADIVKAATSGNGNIAAHRKAVETAFASMFANLLISRDVPIPSKEKERRGLDERKRSVVEPFLKIIGVDNQGPSGGGS